MPEPYYPAWFDVSPQVFEEMFKDGNVIRGRVVEGLPKGTRIAKITTPPFFDPQAQEGTCNQFVRFWLQGPNLKPGPIHITIEKID